MEEGTFIASHKAELLKSKSERHKAIVMRTTTQVVQGGAEPCRGSKEEDIEKSYIGRRHTGGGGGEGVVGGAEEGEQSLGTSVAVHLVVEILHFGTEQPVSMTTFSFVSLSDQYL